MHVVAGNKNLGHKSERKKVSLGHFKMADHVCCTFTGVVSNALETIFAGAERVRAVGNTVSLIAIST